MKTALVVILVAACGGGGSGSTDSGGGGGGGGGGDAPAIDAPQVFLDAPPNVPATIKISGTATADGQSSSTPLGGVAVAFYKASDETTALGSATSGSDGTYSMTITTGGAVLDGFVLATASTYTSNYIYPVAPLFADFEADPGMITSSNFSLLGLLTGQTATDGFLTVSIVDANDANVSGATISSTPAATYRYTDPSEGTPTATTSTGSDGVGYYINVPVGNVTISAAKAGITFRSHTLKAHAGALTTTLIKP